MARARDRWGIPDDLWEAIALLVPDPTNPNGRQRARATLEGIAAERSAPAAGAPQGLCLDKGYDFGEVREIAEEFGFTAHIRCRGEEAQEVKRQAGRKARRWVV